MKTDDLDDEHIVRLLGETRDEITRADSKASILLGAASVTIGVILTSLLSDDARIARLANWIEWLSWVGGAAVLAGVGFLTAAVAPTTGAGEHKRAEYFADFAACKTVEELARNLREQRGGEIARHLRQLHTLAGIATRKFKLIRRGIGLLEAGALAITLSVLLDYVA